MNSKIPQIHDIMGCGIVIHTKHILHYSVCILGNLIPAYSLSISQTHA